MNRSEWNTGDENVARLLDLGYDPPVVSAAFAQRVRPRLLEVAAERSGRRRVPSRWARRAALAAMLLALSLASTLLPRAHSPLPDPALHEGKGLAAAKRAPLLTIGSRVANGKGERRRFGLEDGSVLSLNENSRIAYDALRHLQLQAGEIYVEAAPRPNDGASLPFTVATPDRQIRALGTKFLVRSDKKGTGVAVAQGHVRVDDNRDLLFAGQQLAPGSKSATSTPRLTHLLDWTRDLVVADSPPLVPPSAYDGGALVAVDPEGQCAKLSLRKYHIDVHIEDGFARTTIDQTYFNRADRRLEGKFYFPLPADSSLSRLAMYVDGQLMEGGMVEREYGRIAFDRIVATKKDPALLEWVDGHTFKMRVFPLEARQEKRIILSYTQRLPNLYGRSTYRFPAGHSLGTVQDWSFRAFIKNGADIPWHCDSHQLTGQKNDKSDLLLDNRGAVNAMDRDLVLSFGDSSDGESVRVSTVEQYGFRYLMLRYRPNMPSETKRRRRDWVILFESSAERDPLLAHTQVEIVRTLLNHAEPDDTLTVLAANTQVRAFASEPIPATPRNVAAALAFLERSPRLGALDLDAGLTAAAESMNRREHPLLVHLGSGNAVLGERRAEVLAGRLPQRATYVGIGVGKGWARNFMYLAAQRCRGSVTEINPDEPVAWRAFDLFATLNTPRWTEVRVVDDSGKAHFLLASSTVAQGEELCAVARYPADSPLPRTLRVLADREGEPIQLTIPVESPRRDAAYLPRTWARWEIDRLFAEDAVKHEETIVALSKAMYVMTPYTSLLVLENEEMYARYKVDRGRKDHWAMYPCPAKLPAVDESHAPNGLDQEIYELGFFPPAMALKVKGDGGIHTRGSNLQIDEESDRPEFFPPAMALRVRGTSTIHTAARNLWVLEREEKMRREAGGRPPDAMTIGGMNRLPLAAQFAGRSAAARQKLLSAMGGNRVSEASVMRGLRWLAQHQAEDGHWSSRDFPRHARSEPLPRGKNHFCECGGIDDEADDVFVTSMAVLPFLAAGITHRSEKTTNKDYQQTVASALTYLIAQQKKDGSFREDTLVNAVTAMAVSEAYALSSDTQFRSSAQLALRYLESKQPTNGRESGVHRTHDDFTAAAWAYLAIECGQRAGLEVSREYLKKYERLLGLAFPVKGDASPTANALALLCRLNGEVDPPNRELRLGLQRLQSLSLDQNTDVECLFYATQVMFQMQGGDWRWWNEGIDWRGYKVHSGCRDFLIALQDRGVTKGHSHRMGSWAPALRSSLGGGRIVSTALSLLCLEVYFSHLPLYRPNRESVPSPSLSLDSMKGFPEAEKRDFHPNRLPWRRAARDAERQKRHENALLYLQKSVELEWNATRDLDSIRRDGIWFFTVAEQCLEGFVERGRAVPRRYLDAIVAVADAWREVDPEDWRPCWLASRLLSLVGERSLAWSYATSPAILQLGSAPAWLELARQQHGWDDYDCADRAYAVAESLAPNHAEIAGERKLNRRAVGRIAP